MSKHGDENVKPSWKDYVALSIAALETIMIPAIVLIVILLALVFLFSILR